MQTTCMTRGLQGKHWTCKIKVPWHVSDVETKNFNDFTETLHSGLGLSFQHQIQGSMTLFVELRIFYCFVFCLNIFYSTIAITLAYKVATLAFGSTAP